MLARARSLFSRVFLADATPTLSDYKSDTTMDPRLHKPSTTVGNDDDEWPAEFCLSASGACGDHDRTKAPLRYRRSSYDKTRQYRLVNAMQIATSRGNVEAMKRLLNNVDIDINHRDQNGMSYLEQAILMGSADMVDLLIRYGCDMSQGQFDGNVRLRHSRLSFEQVIRTVIRICTSPSKRRAINHRLSFVVYLKRIASVCVPTIYVR